MFLLKKLISSNDDKRMLSIYSIETYIYIYIYGMNKDLVCKKEEIKCNNVIEQYKKLT